MTNNFQFRVALLGFSFFLIFAVSVQIQAAPAKQGQAKNVIIMVADGMGFNAAIAGTFYRYGEGGQQRYQSFPVCLGSTTFARAAATKEIPPGTRGYDPNVFWVSLANADQSTEFTRKTDSAAAGTAMFGGVKVPNGTISVDANDEPIELISEIAVKMGKKVGCVTSVAISHSTPATFVAHVSSRGSYHEIFRQMVGENSPVTVLMGAGHPFFDQGLSVNIPENESKKAQDRRFMYIDSDSWKSISTGKINGYTVIETKTQFDELATGKGEIPEKVLGIARGAMSIPPADGNLEDMEETREMLRTSYKNTNWADIPSLSTMSIAAINVLTKENEVGFVLMIEGGAIDFANHSQDMTRNVLEHTGFAKAIDAVIDWIEANSSWEETLLVITADHETGQLFGEGTYNDDNNNGVFDEGDSFNDFEPLQSDGRGSLPKHQYASKGHTNSLVPIWAKGPGAELFLKKVRGNDKQAGQSWGFSGDYVDNTDVFDVIKTAICP